MSCYGGNFGLYIKVGWRGVFPYGPDVVFMTLSKCRVPSSLEQVCISVPGKFASVFLASLHQCSWQVYISVPGSSFDMFQHAYCPKNRGVLRSIL